MISGIGHPSIAPQALGLANMNDELIMRLKQAAREDGWRIGPAPAEQLRRAEVEGLPKELVEFYRKRNPPPAKKQPPLEPPLDDASHSFPLAHPSFVEAS